MSSIEDNDLITTPLQSASKLASNSFKLYNDGDINFDVDPRQSSCIEIVCLVLGEMLLDCEESVTCSGKLLGRQLVWGSCSWNISAVCQTVPLAGDYVERWWIGCMQ